MRRWLACNMVFRLHECAKGHATFQILAEMEAADRLSSVELDQLRAERLQNLIAYCHSHVPYIRTYMREAGIAPSQIWEPRDLARLPVMAKADMRQHRTDLRSEVAGKLAPFSTGGSTGEPLIFDLAKRRIASRVACRQRVSKWWGVTIGDPELALWGSPVELSRQDYLRRVRDGLLRTRLLPAFEMDGPKMSRYLDILVRGGCKQIFAYPSAIYLLCLHSRKENRDLRKIGVKVVFVTGEVLMPYQREVISETLNCPVADGYGGRDSGFIAHECPQGGMHVMADAVILEVLDSHGKPVGPGEVGEIVATDLYSHEAPFIRYATGDLGAMSSHSCRCGRALPLLEKIEGRSNDSILTPDGRIINSLALIYPVREVEGIEQFRIRQKAVDCFHVQVVRNERFPRDGESRIRDGWTQLLRSPAHVTFEYLPALPREGSGKFRHVISDLRPEERQTVGRA